MLKNKFLLLVLGLLCFLFISLIKSDFPKNVVFSQGSPLPKFWEMTKETQIDFSGSLYNTSWTDINNDFYPDLYISQHFLSPLLFINQRNGSFKEMASTYQIYPGRDRHGASFGDINNDGWVDFFQTTGAFLGYGIGLKELFLQVPGEQKFINVAGESGIVADEARGRSTNLVDFDNDGDLDLFMANHTREGYTNNLFQNNGNNQFNDISSQSGFTDEKGSSSSTWADFDNDGDLDLLVSGITWTDSEGRSYDQPTILYQNENPETIFTDVSDQVGLGTDVKKGKSATFADFDNDGDLDLFVPVDNSLDLYYENQNGTFLSHDASVLGINVVGREKASASAIDFDNDGDLDLFVARGEGQFSPLYQNLFKENGILKFNEVSGQCNLITNEASRQHSHAWADFDNDGFQDLAFVGGHGSPGNIHLYKNKANQNNFLKIKLMGNQSNKDGVGAKIKIETESQLQFREKSPGGSYYSQVDPFVHFGLGESVKVDKLTINWPSGSTQELLDIPANHFIVVTEGAMEWSVAQPPPPENNLLQNSDFENEIQPWELVTRNEAEATISVSSETNSISYLGNKAASIESASLGTQPKDITFKQGPFLLNGNKDYRLVFWGKASSENLIQIVLRRAVSPWGHLAEGSKTLKPWWVKYHLNFTPTETAEMNLAFDIGGNGFPKFFDNIYLGEIFSQLLSPLYPSLKTYLTLYNQQDLQQIETIKDNKINGLDFAKLLIDNNYAAFPPQ